MKKANQQVSRSLTALGCACLLGACVSNPSSPTVGGPAEHSPTTRGIDDFVLVDCLLPGQIRSLGTSMTYLTARRSVKATRSDCAIRGGEYVLFDRSDYRSALQSLLPQAQSGDATAQAYVAEIYEKGLGLPGPDYVQAASWYRKAADQGYSAAQTSLGSLYERGLGVPRDKAKALEWYRRATGLTNDRLVFESALEAERKTFRKEIALRNRVAASLRRQLSSARARATTPRAAPAQPKTAQSERAILSQIESQRREAEREAEIRTKKLRALEAIQATETRQGEDESGKAAQAGKLKLTLREQRDEFADTSRRLALAN